MGDFKLKANGFRRHRGGIGAILLALGNLKHLKCPQTYTSFPGTGGTVTVENRDVFVEATGTYSRRVTGSPVREAVLGRPVLHCIQASCPSTPQVMGYIMVGSPASANGRF